MKPFVDAVAAYRNHRLAAGCSIVMHAQAHAADLVVIFSHFSKSQAEVCRIDEMVAVPHVFLSDYPFKLLSEFLLRHGARFAIALDVDQAKQREIGRLEKRVPGDGVIPEFREIGDDAAEN